MRLKVLKNSPYQAPPTIRIVEGEPEWDAAYKAWIAGRNPTADPAWKEGVYFSYMELPKIVPQKIIILNKSHIHTTVHPAVYSGSYEWDWVRSDHKRIRKLRMPECREHTVCYCSVNKDHVSIGR